MENQDLSIKLIKQELKVTRLEKKLNKQVQNDCSLYQCKSYPNYVKQMKVLLKLKENK